MGGRETSFIQNSLFSERARKQIFVTKMNYVDSVAMSADDVFKGYDELFAITYSHGLSRIEHIMSYFKNGEIVIGCSDLVGRADAVLFAAQEYVINYTGKNKYLKSRVDAGELKFFVVGNVVSHEKIYLLRSSDGDVRTILASANFSDAAWSGKQKENVVICDDRKCFDVYMERYCDLRDNYCDNIVKNAVLIDETYENLDELPIVKRVRKNGVVIINSSDKSDSDSEYGFFIAQKIPEMAKKLKESRIVPDVKGLIELVPEKIDVLVARAKKESASLKEKRRVFPQFVIDYLSDEISLNGKKWNLHPEESEIRRDLDLFKKHMDGFNPGLFVGDVGRLRSIYWKVLNYMFLSPFIAKIRYEIGNDDWLRYAPMYLLLSGSSDAGKTAFVKLVRKMMFNGNYSQSLLSNRYFSTEQSAVIKVEAKGYPAIIDEVSSAQWAQAQNIVKNDADLIENSYVNHPCFILIANELNGVRPEISKRVMVFNPDCRMPSDIAMKNGLLVKTIGNEIGNALYREYARMILERLPDVFESSRKDMAPPDVWKLSSGVLREIFDRFDAFPDFHVQTWHDYVGEKNICDRALRLIMEEYLRNPGAFKVIERYNQLVIDFSLHEPNERQKILAYLVKETPATCLCKQLGPQASLNLAAAEAYTGLKFNSPGVLDKIKAKLRQLRDWA